MLGPELKVCAIERVERVELVRWLTVKEACVLVTRLLVKSEGTRDSARTVDPA